MGAVGMVVRFRWRGEDRGQHYARDTILDLVLRRLDVVAGERLAPLWPAIQDWVFSGREHDTLATHHCVLGFHDHWGLLAQALEHWTQVMLAVAPRSRDEWLAERGLVLEGEQAVSAAGPFVLLNGALARIERDGFVTDRKTVRYSEIGPEQLAELERLYLSGACCWLCYAQRASWAFDNLHSAPVSLAELFALQHAPAAATLRRFVTRPRSTELDDSPIEQDFGSYFTARAPEVVAEALRSASTSTRRRARALLELNASVAHVPSVAAALTELSADEREANEAIDTLTSVVAPTDNDPVSRIVALIDRGALEARRGEDPVNDAWQRSMDPEAMLALLDRGARLVLLCFERAESGEVVVSELDDDLEPIERRVVALGTAEDAALIRGAMPTLPSTERWVEQLDPGLVPEELRLSVRARELRRYGRLMRRWAADDFVYEFDRSDDPSALLTVLAHAQQREALVSALRVLRERDPRASLRSAIARMDELDGDVCREIGWAVGMVSATRAAADRLESARDHGASQQGLLDELVLTIQEHDRPRIDRGAR